MLDILFNPEDGGDRFLGDVGEPPADHTELYPRG
jgi:hypothetical protein